MITLDTVTHLWIQINKSNVGSLKVAWTFSTGVLRGHEGGPLVIGDTMYVHTAIPNIVYALDLNDNQRIIWKYNPVKGGKYPGGETMDRVISVMCCDNVNRGVNYHPNGTIVLHAADTSVIALDAKTGKESGLQLTYTLVLVNMVFLHQLVQVSHLSLKIWLA